MREALGDDLFDGEPPARRRIKYVCASCGGDEMSWDATARWSEADQEFEMSGDVCDTSYCDDCGGEAREKVLDLDTGEELKQPPRGMEWLPVAEADALWDEWRADGERERAERKAMAQAEENAAALAAAYGEVE